MDNKLTKRNRRKQRSHFNRNPRNPRTPRNNKEHLQQSENVAALRAAVAAYKEAHPVPQRWKKQENRKYENELPAIYVDATLLLGTYQSLRKFYVDVKLLNSRRALARYLEIHFIKPEVERWEELKRRAKAVRAAVNGNEPWNSVQTKLKNFLGEYDRLAAAYSEELQNL